jgi:hypothetical protein
MVHALAHMPSVYPLLSLLFIFIALYRMLANDIGGMRSKGCE